VLGLFLNDAEDAGGCLPSLLAARYRRSQNPAVGIVDSDVLIAQQTIAMIGSRDVRSTDSTDRSFRPLAASAPSPIADHTGQACNDDSRRPQPRLHSLRPRFPLRCHADKTQNAIRFQLAPLWPEARQLLIGAPSRGEYGNRARRRRDPHNLTFGRTIGKAAEIGACFPQACGIATDISRE
jgi:hypothetical protein